MPARLRVLVPPSPDGFKRPQGGRVFINRAGKGRQLEFVFFKRFERGGPATQDVVFGLAVKDMNAAVVKQSRLGDDPPRRRLAYGTFRERLVADLLYRLEAVAFLAFVFVERHMAQNKATYDEQWPEACQEQLCICHFVPRMAIPDRRCQCALSFSQQMWPVLQKWHVSCFKNSLTTRRRLAH